jgi:hypothetical protein
MSTASSTTAANDAIAHAESSPIASETGPSVDAVLEDGEKIPSKPHRGLHFWMIIVGLSVAGILPGLESTIITTSLPTITAELDIGENFIWIANVFFLTR